MEGPTWPPPASALLPPEMGANTVSNRVSHFNVILMIDEEQFRMKQCTTEKHSALAYLPGMSYIADDPAPADTLRDEVLGPLTGS